MSEVYKALLKSQMEMGTIKKDEKNPFFKSSYATLNNIREVVVPVLNKNGLVLSQPGVLVEGRQFVETRITHADTGEAVTGLTEVLAKNAGDAQQAGSGISYSRRYGLMSLLCLAAEDDDGNSASGKEVSKFKSTPGPSKTSEEAIKVSQSLTKSVSSADIAIAVADNGPKKKVTFSKKAAVAAVEDEL